MFYLIFWDGTYVYNRLQYHYYKVLNMTLARCLRYDYYHNCNNLNENLNEMKMKNFHLSPEASPKAVPRLPLSLSWFLASFLALGSGTGLAQSQTEAAGSQVGQLLRQVVEEKLMECHLVALGDTDAPASIMATLLR